MDTICIGMIGAGRATQLHMEGLKKVSISGLKLRFKTIVARRESQLLQAQQAYGFENISTNIDDILQDEEIDIIDICTPAYTHENIIFRAINANKHIICEKPFVGYFGDENGMLTSKTEMYDHVINILNKISSELENKSLKFMYAENFIYAPAIEKAAEIIRHKKSKLLYMKGEESLKGSSSKVAGEWNKTGGGSLIRVGVHPLTAILWLKQQEAITHNKIIKVESILADVETILPTLSDYERRHIKANPQDVEDMATLILTFSDKSRAVIMATDTCLGGSKNYVELYCNDATLNCKLTMNDLMETYFLDEENINDVYLSEMLPSKIGWNKPFIADEIIRGYVGQMQDFVEAVYFNRQPQSDFRLAYETTQIVYAAYKSAELGRRVYL
ncbi:MAG: oxidoreductase [Epulopiscium sp. Nele67-Bin004]|nr:MAG: oxidoreductase [Epulopiscium sp. Nele67-Bin004]